MNYKCCDEMEIIETRDYYVCNSCGRIKQRKYDYIIIKNNNHNIIGYDKNKYLEYKIKCILDKNKNIDGLEKEKMANNINELYMKIYTIIQSNKLYNKYSLNYDFLLYKIMDYLNYDTQYNKITKNKKLYNKYNNIWNIIISDISI